MVTVNGDRIANQIMRVDVETSESCNDCLAVVLATYLDNCSFCPEGEEIDPDLRCKPWTHEVIEDVEKQISRIIEREFSRMRTASG